MKKAIFFGVISILVFLLCGNSLANFYDDKEIGRLISDLELELEKVSDDRDSEIIKEKLQDIVKAAENEFMPEDFDPTIDYLEMPDEL